MIRALELAVACDVRLVTTRSSFGLPEIKLGIPSVIDAGLLQQYVGLGHAKEMILTGDLYPATAPQLAGLCNRLVEPSGLEEVLETFLAKVTSHTTTVLASQKRLFETWQNTTTNVGIDVGVGEFVGTFAAADTMEALTRYGAELGIERESAVGDGPPRRSDPQQCENRRGHPRMTKPLEGMLVVSLEQAVAAPLATCRLADAGARVIKIERTSGDFARGYDRAVHGESAYFVWLNRGKESICLDFTREEDAALLRAMISRADVFVQNLGPGAAARAGLEAESLVEANPRLVACTISGYGRTGPYAQMKAYDLLIQAESGLASVTGTPEAPGRVGVSACDIAAGLSAHAGIVEALLRRATTGSGGVVDVSMFAAMAEWMAVPLLHWEHQHTIWPRVGLNHPVIAPYGAYPTAGEGMVLVGIQNDVQWRRFAERLLDRPELAGDERYATNVERVAHRAEIDGLVEGFLAPLTADEAVARLVQVDIPCARINGVPELAAHPQLSRLGVDTPAGTVSVTAPPTQHSTWSLESASVPALDQHGAALREEFATTEAP